MRYNETHNMRPIIAVFAATLFCVPAFGAARSATAPQRAESRDQRQTADSETRQTTTRAAAAQVSARTAGATAEVSARAGAVQTTQSRAAATPARSATTVARTAATPAAASRAATSARSALVPVGASMNSDYNACRDAYFTCMDQFCAYLDDTYRRCVCSARLDKIRETERQMKQTSEQLKDFADWNIDAISKSSQEVAAMLKTSAGEYAAGVAKKYDKSDSAAKLSGISEVLSTTKNKALSTAGILDIAGNINAIWSSSDLIGGADISSLDGAKLYDQVHAQCMEMAASSCTRSATLNMVVSAYGMYIEQDCNTIASVLEDKRNQAEAAIRQTERNMGAARLETYNAHNSAAINACIAQVRVDITNQSACGPDFVHCLDVTGLYLNYATGDPIYSPNLYKLENMISLDGDVLRNPQNTAYVVMLDKKKESARRGLDTCRDLADGVWEEFKRQAIVEIYQGQQKRIRQVKDDCINVLNACFDEQLKNLRDFSNLSNQFLLGNRVELSEELCHSQLNTCSNLYGGGSEGLAALRSHMYSIGTSRISDNCRASLMEFAVKLCSPSPNDTLHAYPFDCRMYNPGSMVFAFLPHCNLQTSSKIFGEDPWAEYTSGGGGSMYPEPGYYMCEICYVSCSPGYGYFEAGGCGRCEACKPGMVVEQPAGGGTKECEPIDGGPSNDCGDYPGSLYQKLVNYAKDFCERPSETSNPNFILSTKVMEDVNSAMDEIKVSMRKVLQAECERLDGVWSNEINFGEHNETNWAKEFYERDAFWGNNASFNKTNTSPRWGHCDVKVSPVVESPVVE